VKVLEEEGAVWATSSLVGLGMVHWSTAGCGIGWLLVVLEGRGGGLVRTHDCCGFAVKQLYGVDVDSFLYCV
jgi:hypothetical protein